MKRKAPDGLRVTCHSSMSSLILGDISLSGIAIAMAMPNLYRPFLLLHSSDTMYSTNESTYVRTCPFGRLCRAR